MFATSLETYENQSVAAVQQARKITGTLTDAVGEPIIGATVLEKGNPSNGTITDMDLSLIHILTLPTNREV